MPVSLLAVIAVALLNLLPLSGLLYNFVTPTVAKSAVCLLTFAATRSPHLLPSFAAGGEAERKRGKVRRART